MYRIVIIILLLGMVACKKETPITPTPEPLLPETPVPQPPIVQPVPVTPFYIVAGQSNCGRSRVSEMTANQAIVYDTIVNNTFIFNAYRYYIKGITAFEPLDVGLNTLLNNAAYANEFGVETSLAVALQNYKNEKRYFCKFAQGNTSLAIEFSPDTGYVYTQLLQTVDQALKTADSAAIKNLQLKAFIWMQGENDATNAVQANGYKANLQYFFKKFTQWWVVTKGKNSDFKIVIGRIQDIHVGYEKTVREAQESFCADTTNNAYLINTDLYKRKDYIHFSASAQIQFGIDVFNVVKNF